MLLHPNPSDTFLRSLLIEDRALAAEAFKADLFLFGFFRSTCLYLNRSIQENDKTCRELFQSHWDGLKKLPMTDDFFEGYSAATKCCFYMFEQACEPSDPDFERAYTAELEASKLAHSLLRTGGLSAEAKRSQIASAGYFRILFRERLEIVCAIKSLGSDLRIRYNTAG